MRRRDILQPLSKCTIYNFLYFFANTISQDTDNRLLADKLYYLNKIMNGCDLYHEVNLPHYFTLDHPVVALWDGLNM